LLSESQLNRIAELAIRLKAEYRRTLALSPGYGSDTATTKQIDQLGLVIKELEDMIVLMLVELEKENKPEDRT
jgi:hypothetical protein